MSSPAIEIVKHTMCTLMFIFPPSIAPAQMLLYHYYYSTQHVLLASTQHYHQCTQYRLTAVRHLLQVLLSSANKFRKSISTRVLFDFGPNTSERARYMTPVRRAQQRLLSVFDCDPNRAQNRVRSKSVSHTLHRAIDIVRVVDRK